MEKVQFGKLELTVWDIGGQEQIRRLWRYCRKLTKFGLTIADYQNTNGIVFVVDASDRERIFEAREELADMLKADELRNAALLVYANKQDMPNAMTAVELTDNLGLYDVRQRDWYVQGTCATAGEGLNDGKRSIVG